MRLSINDDYYLTNAVAQDVETGIDLMLEVADGLLENMFASLNVRDALIMLADTNSDFINTENMYFIKSVKDNEIEGFMYAYKQNNEHLPDAINSFITPSNKTLLEKVMFSAPIGSFYLNTLYVAPKCRGLGLGSLLLDLVKMQAANASVSSVYLHCYADNYGALKLYENFGFKVIESFSYESLITKDNSEGDKEKQSKDVKAFKHQEGLILRFDL